jgi:hypothetical protein
MVAGSKTHSTLPLNHELNTNRGLQYTYQQEGIGFFFFDLWWEGHNQSFRRRLKGWMGWGGMAWGFGTRFFS